MKMSFPRNKYGLQLDPVGEYVQMYYKGRSLLGEVVETYRRELPSNIMAKVRHFNGDIWPIEPVITALTWIKQDAPVDPDEDERSGENQ